MFPEDAFSITYYTQKKKLKKNNFEHANAKRRKL